MMAAGHMVELDLECLENLNSRYWFTGLLADQGEPRLMVAYQSYRVGL